MHTLGRSVSATKQTIVEESESEIKVSRGAVCLLYENPNSVPALRRQRSTGEGLKFYR